MQRTVFTTFLLSGFLALAAQTLAQVDRSVTPARQGSHGKRVLNIAHRGARSLAPENTLQAFRIGVSRCRADMIELDVHLSKDGVPVVIHDDTLERTTNVAERFPRRAPFRVFDFTLAEMRTLDAGSWFVETDPFQQIRAGEVPSQDLAMFSSGRVRIPTLNSVLELVKELDTRVNIELKNYPAFYPGLAEKVVDEVRRAGVMERVVFSSFDHEILVRLRQLAPEIPCAALLDQPVHPLKEYVAGLLQASAVNPGLAVLGFDSQAFHRGGGIRTDFLTQARDAGLAVNVWTVNDPEIMTLLIEAGVTGIFTDFPQRLDQILVGRSGR